MLPDTLEKAGVHIFYDCPEVKVIWVGSRLDIKSIRKEHDRDSVMVLPMKTPIGNELL